MTRAKMYLGDGVYLAPDSTEGLVLTTEDGIRATNRIVLELDVCRTLLDVLHSYLDDPPKPSPQ